MEENTPVIFKERLILMKVVFHDRPTLGPQLILTEIQQLINSRSRYLRVKDVAFVELKKDESSILLTDKEEKEIATEPK